MRVLGHNYATGLGEIDVVALDGNALVFAEVKTRTPSQLGKPEDAVTPAKQRKLTQLALAFMREHDQADRPCRFDVVAVDWPADDEGEPTIRHYPNAFPASAGYEAY